MEKEIDAKTKKAFEAADNQTKSIVPITDWKIIDDIHYSDASEVKCVRFQGNAIEKSNYDMSESLRIGFTLASKILSPIIAPVCRITDAVSGGDLETQWSDTETLYFHGLVQSVKLRVITDDILHHTNLLEHSIDG